MQTTSFTCQEFVELVTEYLERALSPPERAVCDDHLADCSLCRAYLDQMRQTIRALGALIGESTSAAAQTELLAAFRAWKDSPSPGPVP